MNEMTDTGKGLSLLERCARVDTAEVVRALEGEITGRMWPAGVEVQTTGVLPDLEYAEPDFRRIMEVLLTSALQAPGCGEVRTVVVGCRSDVNLTVFSVHSSAVGAFAGGNGGPGPLAEVNALARANGGRLWVDGESGSGSTAFFTTPKRKDARRLLSHDTRW